MTNNTQVPGKKVESKKQTPESPKQKEAKEAIKDLPALVKKEIGKLKPESQILYAKEIHPNLDHVEDVTKRLLPDIAMNMTDLELLYKLDGIAPELPIGTQTFIHQCKNGQPIENTVQGTDGKHGPITKGYSMKRLIANPDQLAKQLYRRLQKKEKLLAKSERGQRFLAYRVSASEAEVKEAFKREKYISYKKGEHFDRGVGYFKTKDNTKYWHIVRKAVPEPLNGVREMGGRWNFNVIRQWAVQLEKKFRVPRALIMGFADLESGKGYNSLSRTLGNYFGIKPGSVAVYRRFASKKLPNYSQYQHLPDFLNRKHVQAHNHYADAWSSFYHFAYLVSKGSRYRNHLKLSSLSAKAAAIAFGGYCPGTNYIAKVISRISKYGNPGTLDYNELKQNLKEANTWQYVGGEGRYWERLQLAARKGYVTNFPSTKPS